VTDTATRENSIEEKKNQLGKELLHRCVLLQLCRCCCFLVLLCFRSRDICVVNRQDRVSDVYEGGKAALLTIARTHTKKKNSENRKGEERGRSSRKGRRRVPRCGGTEERRYIVDTVAQNKKKRIVQDGSGRE
jgi:hypothetical protein